MRVLAAITDDRPKIIRWPIIRSDNSATPLISQFATPRLAPISSPMHIAWCILPFLFGFADVSVALRTGKWCPRACDLTTGYVTFNDTDPWLSRKVRQCRSDLRITSLYLCLDEFCSLQDGEVPKFIAENNEWCDEHAGVTLPPFHDIVDRWTPEDRAQLPRHSAEQAAKWPVLNTVVLPEDDFFERAFTTLVGKTIHDIGCKALIGSGCCVLRI